MNNISQETSDKQKKLDALRKRKEEREKQQAIEKQQANQSTEISNKQTNIDDLVNSLLGEQETTLSPIKKSFVEVKEPKSPLLSIKRVSKVQKRNLSFISFVGEFHMESKQEKITIDQGTQVDEKMFEIINKNSTNSFSNKKLISEEDALPQKKQQYQNQLEFSNNEQQQLEKQLELKELTSEEAKQIFNSANFIDFFNKASKKIEREFNEEVQDIESLIHQNFEDTQKKKTDTLIQVHKFYDPHYSANRVITAMEWSKNIDNMFLAAYSQNDQANINDPMGVVLLWSTSLRNRPEYQLFCQSNVTSACFNPYSNNIVIGGLYNGQIVIWDLRQKSTPIQRTTMSSGGHAYPIYSLDVVGTQNAHNIVSLSNDGQLCVWSMDMLNQPQISVKLETKNRQNNDINATTMAFTQGETNNFFVGSEDGNVYSAQIHGNQLKSDNIIQTFEGHKAPVTSLSVQSNTKECPAQLQGLVLSSSFDWTVKLWSPYQTTEPILSFESAEDYIFDVAWNPLNPTLFSSVDGEGYVDIWDIVNDYESPAIHLKADDKNAINKVRWHKNGYQLLTGDSVGNLKIHELEKDMLQLNYDKLDDLYQIINQNSSLYNEDF